MTYQQVSSVLSESLRHRLCSHLLHRYFNLSSNNKASLYFVSFR
nr:MAG TPA: hypothetical protein [Caudoviricetes sp.]